MEKILLNWKLVAVFGSSQDRIASELAGRELPEYDMTKL